MRRGREGTSTHLTGLAAGEPEPAPTSNAEMERDEVSAVPADWRGAA